jgi:ubiquinone/menaquinone biosynthesis C-methylase UbiE
MINKKDTWNKLYENSKLKDIENRINLGLKDKKNLVIYYPWLNLIIKNRLKFKRSLEVGSGTGSYSLILKKLGLVEEVYLFDWSEESLKLAKKLFEHYGEKAHFIQGDAKNLPFKDNFFDLTLSGGLLEHFSR